MTGALKFLLIIQAIIASALTNNTTAVSTRWGILTTIHTINLAKTISIELMKTGGNTEVKVWTTPPQSYDLDKYIVLTAYAFVNNLPPMSKTYIYQVEHHGSKRFTKEYQNVISQALGVLEYNPANFVPLNNLGIYSTYSRIWYLPVASRLKSNTEHTSKLWDVLFYGSLSNRRLHFLEALKNQSFSYHIVNSTYADDILSIIQKAHIVVNIHCYDHPSLEVLRLVECMSVGVPVVTEWSEDLSSFPYLLHGLKSFEYNSTQSMIEVIQNMLKDPISEEVVLKAAKRAYRVFSPMFHRFLVGVGEMPISTLVTNHSYINLQSYDNVVVSLPETSQRHEVFKSYWKYGRIYSFAGVRYTHGWYGCAMTYKLLAQAALQAKKKHITIMEDDVVLPDQYLTFKAHIDEYLQSLNGEWDIFCGIIADLPGDVQIKRIDVFHNMTFLTINRMTSMVYNIYNQRALQIMSDWEVPLSHMAPKKLSAMSTINRYTIDRVLEKSTMSVITTIPFYIGHRESLRSTLWNGKNTRYNKMFALVIKMLQRKIKEYYKSHN